MLFFYFFVAQLLERGSDQKDLGDVKNEYDKRFGRLDEKIEEELQKAVKEI